MQMHPKRHPAKRMQMACCQAPGSPKILNVKFLAGNSASSKGGVDSGEYRWQSTAESRSWGTSSPPTHAASWEMHHLYYGAHVGPAWVPAAAPTAVWRDLPACRPILGVGGVASICGLRTAASVLRGRRRCSGVSLHRESALSGGGAVAARTPFRAGLLEQ